MEAARNASSGSDNNPARSSRNMKGVHCQVSTIITVTFARVSSLSHRGVISNRLRKSFTGPRDSWKTVFQITVMMTGVVIIGIRNNTRKNRLKAKSRQTISASEKPSTYCRNTVVSDRKLSRKKDSQKRWSSVNSRT